MRISELSDRLESSPVIAAIRDNKWRSALASPSEVLFYLEETILTKGFFSNFSKSFSPP